MSDMNLRARLLTLPQYLIPQHRLSALMFALTRSRLGWFKDLFIRVFIHLYRVDMSIAERPDPDAYRCFNDFFTRSLQPSARPVVTDPGLACCPVDGEISQIGTIESGRIIQAKRRYFALDQLLGGETDISDPFRGGGFATIYLSPRDYHRIHMPMAGTLRSMIYIPGRLFSVNQRTALAVPGLFARNERVACVFDTAIGPMALVLVGAIFVGSMETVWHGLITPSRERRYWRRDYPGADGQAPALDKGGEMGRFNMGSTVIVLLPPGRGQWLQDLHAGSQVMMGQALARLRI